MPQPRPNYEDRHGDGARQALLRNAEDLRVVRIVSGGTPVDVGYYPLPPHTIALSVTSWQVIPVDAALQSGDMLATDRTTAALTAYSLSGGAVGGVCLMARIAGNWWLIPAAGGKCSPIRFQINSVNTPFHATCSVTAVPSGFTLADVPGVTLVYQGAIVEVYDPIGCFFNEPAGLLMGRQGWAHYMQPAGIGFPTATGVDPYDVPEWEVFSLCCNTASCE